MSLPGSKKRRIIDAENEKKWQVAAPTDGLPAASAAKRSKNRSLTAIQHQFLDQKKCLLQQAHEQANQSSDIILRKVLYESPPDPDKLELALAESLRVVEEINSLFGRKPARVVSMGFNDSNQLGIAPGDDEEKQTSNPPTILPTVYDIDLVVAGGAHSLAIANDGKAYSWGVNDDFALGRDTTGTG